MNIFANRRIRVEEDIITRIARNLNGSGDINVQLGQEVAPLDVIGTSTGTSGFRTIDLTKLLEVKPIEVKKYLKRSIGEKIYKGEILAAKDSSLFKNKKTVLAPSDGTLFSLDEKTGQLRLQFIAKKESVAASVFGIVEKVDKLRQQVIIKTQVTHVHGVLGSGKQREGTIDFLGQRGGLITAPMIGEHLANRILISGGFIYKEAIAAAVANGANGIITGGINARDYIGMSGSITQKSSFGTDIGISVLVTEGFGSLPIGNDIYQILQKYDGKFAILDGNQGVLNLPSFDPQCMIRIKSSQLPPLQGETVIEAVPSLEAHEIKLGQIVRVIAPPFMSEQGRVVSIDKQPTKLQSGVVAEAVTIETKSRKIAVPYLNLEII